MTSPWGSLLNSVQSGLTVRLALLPSSSTPAYSKGELDCLSPTLSCHVVALRLVLGTRTLYAYPPLQQASGAQLVPRLTSHDRQLMMTVDDRVCSTCSKASSSLSK